MTVVVSNYGDLISNEFLNVERADAVVREFDAGHELVARVPDWLIVEKDYPASQHAEEIIARSVERETEAAYLLANGDAEVWFPKSVIVAFEAADDAEFVQPERRGGVDDIGGTA